MSVIEEMRTRLDGAFAPTLLEVEDESEQHRGHSGWKEGGETHFHVRIQGPAFRGLSRIERHRAIHEALGRELLTRVHALRLTVGP